MSTMRIIIAGGGTGGHIFPAVAIAHALVKQVPGVKILFVGANGKMEMEKVPAEGFDIVGLDIAGFNRSNILKNIMLPYKILMSHLRAKSILKNFKPDAVVGVGGYASFPVLNAAQGIKIPTLIQEQNSYAGKSNKMLGRRANAICVAYEHMDKFFPKDKLEITGNPVRKNIAHSVVTKQDGLAKFGLGAAKRTLLIVGGSLGAKAINEAINAGMDEVLKENVQVLWQTGKPYYEQAVQCAAAFGDKVKVYEFIKDMEHAYAAADVVISRAGALAIAELCIAGKPVIFVPLPTAAEDHQTTNAMALVQRNAAVLVRNIDAKQELVKKLRSVLNDAKMQELMTKNLQAMAIKDADERIATKVMKIATSKA